MTGEIGSGHAVFRGIEKDLLDGIMVSLELPTEMQREERGIDLRERT